MSREYPNWYRYQHDKIIVTRRIWQLTAAAGFVLLTTLAEYYPFNPRFGWWLGGLIFTVVFSLTYLREERRAAKSPDSNLVLNWNLAEAVLLLLSTVCFYVWSFISGMEKMYFYAYLHPGALGLLVGVGLAEFFWQNTRLKQIDESCRERYWNNYKDSIW